MARTSGSLNPKEKCRNGGIAKPLAVWILMKRLPIACLLVVQIIPVLIIFAAAFQPSQLSLGENWDLSQWGLGHFRRVLGSDNFLSHLSLSTQIALGSATLSVFGATLAAYALVYGRFPGLRFFRGSVFVARMMPPAALILPIFLLLRTSGLADTVVGLILAHTAWNLPFGIWLMLPFFRAIPEEIFQAAQMDGCSYGQIFRWIMVPLAVPGMVVAFLFCFLMSWNDFLFSLILGGSQTKTAALVVNGYVAADQISWGPMAASATLILMPAFGLAWFLQRHLVEGLAAGSVKG